ncbi:hypothetical protein K7432_003747 [Basidiobolus ranarum]|uniref:Uncharacterized protein n=1 Tax=Basidiobolus ranarum TaxID=34480 RepID=A0ABR2WZD7_9FUNG
MSSSEELDNLTSVQVISDSKFNTIKDEIQTLKQLQGRIFSDIRAQRTPEAWGERDTLLERIFTGITQSDTLIPTGNEMTREAKKDLVKELQSSQMRAETDLKTMLEQWYQTLKPDAYDTQIYEAVRGNDEIIVGNLRAQYANNPNDSPVLFQLSLARRELHSLEKSLQIIRELSGSFYRMDKAENKIEEFQVKLPSRTRSKRTKIMFVGTILITLGLLIGVIVTQVH